MLCCRGLAGSVVRVMRCIGRIAVASLLVLQLAGRPVFADAPADGACTSFCLDNNGHAVFGSNYDNTIWEGLLFVNRRGVTKAGWEAGTSGSFPR